MPSNDLANQTIFGLDPHTSSFALDGVKMLESDTLKPFIIPVLGLLIGAGMMSAKKPMIATVGKLVLYFGAQSFMNIYMGWVFHINVIVPAGTLIPFPNGTDGGTILTEAVRGAPVGFALTAMQQVISLGCFIILFCCLYYTPYKIMPKKITSTNEVISICIFGCVFALNIALNNFSLGYISIAVNLIIRSCLPLTTFLSQQGLAKFGLYTEKPCKPLEIGLMVCGVFCAAAFTMAKIMGAGKTGGSSSNMVLGVVACIASLLCGSLNLALAGVLGEMKLSVYDTVAYMSLPATLFLLPIAMFWQKPVPGMWPEVFGAPVATDLEILKKVASLSPHTFGLFALSGVFSFAYNIIQFSIVHALSPSATAFGGNFNKAALVFLTLLLPFMQVHDLPGAPYIYVIWAAVIGNVMAFSAYSYLQILEKQRKAAEISGNNKLIDQEDCSGSSDGDDDESEEDSSS